MSQLRLQYIQLTSIKSCTETQSVLNDLPILVEGWEVGEMTLAHEDTVIGDGDDILEVIPDNCRGQKGSNTNLYSSTCRGHCERID